MRTLILATLCAATTATAALAATITVSGQLSGDPIPAGYNVQGTYLIVRNNAFKIEVDARGACHVEFHWQCPDGNGLRSRDGSTQPTPQPAEPGPGTPPGTDPGATPPPAGDPPGPGCIPVPTNTCENAVTTYDIPTGTLRIEGAKCFYVAGGQHLAIGIVAGVPSVRIIKLRHGATITATTSAASLVLDTAVLGRHRARMAAFRTLYGLCK